MIPGLLLLLFISGDIHFLFVTYSRLCYTFIRKRKSFQHACRKPNISSYNMVTHVHALTRSVNAERQTDPFSELSSAFVVICDPLLICNSCSAKMWDLTNGYKI
jgi:hypothetical protein